MSLDPVSVEIALTLRCAPQTQVATAADNDRETEERDSARLTSAAEEDEEEPLEPVSPRKKKAAAGLPGRNDGLSKLEQFKFRAPAAVVSSEEAEEDVLAAGVAAGLEAEVGMDAENADQDM